MPAFDVNGITASYAEAGSGEPVVLLHGSAGSDAHWRGLFDRLAERFQLFAPNLHGYGETDPWPGERALSIADEAALAEALIDRIGTPVHLVGHSYGGAVALRVAHDRPERISRLTLVEPAAFYLLRQGWPSERALFREIAGVATAVSEAVVSGNYRGGMRHFVDYWNGAGAFDGLKPEVQSWLSGQLVKIASEFHAVLSETAVIEDLSAIDTPTSVLRGSRSPGPVRAIAEILSDALPNITLATVSDAGHMLPLTHPESVSAAVIGEACALTTIEKAAA